ncbi:fumarylacetoacetate hydrolase family protein [Reinekea thalattae]|uniref:Fumarylacetoacetate hydrolase family protein n=1 Tax=Reinekea thalattae TaxID=2593301 RepID=A0A5C8ZBP9_9GAMM|nr:fumarylacetoacetate hydrolase family protein [Reinekea thalattae]TXR54709.1 fumarylacetoacetate hydrolase family protein [Reinekea thalattae]
MASVELLGKQITPGKIVCIGRNYVEHIAELNNEVPENMVFFNKPASSIGNTLIAFQNEPIHFEAELCFIFQQAKLASVGFGLDLTKRNLQSQLKSKGLPWERAKAFQNSVVFSPFVPLEAPLEQLSFSLHIDQQLQQQGNIELMINKPTAIVKELEQFSPLQDGDILMTGTPKGVGQIIAGQQFTGRILLNDRVIIEQHWQAI